MEKAKAYGSVMSRLTLAARRAGTRLFASWVLIGLTACSAEPPEQALRKQLAQFQQAVEQGQVQEAMDLVAEDFAGPRGMDRVALHNLLRMQVLANRRVGVTTSPYDVALQQDTATVRFNADEKTGAVAIEPHDEGAPGGPALSARNKALVDGSPYARCR